MGTLPGTPGGSGQGLHQQAVRISRAHGVCVPVSVPESRLERIAKVIEDTGLSVKAAVFATSPRKVASSRRNFPDRQLLLWLILTEAR